jgi:hypothetical protein
MSDSKVIKEAMDDFFSNCGAPNDAHAKLLLQMVLGEALRPGNKNNNRFWVNCDANVPVSGAKGPQGSQSSHGS